MTVKLLKLPIVVFLVTLLNACQNPDMQAILQQCSRETPIAERYWKPTKTQIKELESNLSKLTLLESDLCCNEGKIEGSPHDYFFQYAGVVVNGKRYIYVDAHPSQSTHGSFICDGGKSYWGVLYDPENKSFGSLAFNGAA